MKPAAENLLINLDQNTWAIRNAKVSDDDLLDLADMPDLVIKEIRAPLSSVSTKTLKLFLQVHGRNIEKLNLQNIRIAGQDLVSLLETTPHLKSLSFQYLHDIRDADLLRVIETCRDLESLRISQNRRISKMIFPQILNLDRHFAEISLDLVGSATTSDCEANEQMTRAQIETLRLSGLPFNKMDVIHAASIQSLKTLSLTLTNADPDAVSQLYSTLDPDKPITIEIKDISDKKMSKFASFFSRNNISFVRIHNSITLSK